ncbi:unnamed protein product [Lactuca virosa]|uniref:Protein kinase domain-containing protein n=1 Tax=Lactuca virosa TaxID=75947 RepID=A0AAU9MA33_9ASTR|nr:unnamed protein product [Lactuca virosa]
MLNLHQKIRIILDVASALDSLHNHCLPTIVHCDLKPSNIMLDDDMLNHVGNFDSTQFLGKNSNQHMTSGSRGTIRYAPPEYGVGSVITSSGDVYSFGILLFEPLPKSAKPHQPHLHLHLHPNVISQNRTSRSSSSSNRLYQTLELKKELHMESSTAPPSPLESSTTPQSPPPSHISTQP